MQNLQLKSNLVKILIEELVLIDIEIAIGGNLHPFEVLEKPFGLSTD